VLRKSAFACNCICSLFSENAYVALLCIPNPALLSLQAAGAQGDTAPPPADQDVDLHFITFVEHAGEQVAWRVSQYSLQLVSFPVVVLMVEVHGKPQHAGVREHKAVSHHAGHTPKKTHSSVLCNCVLHCRSAVGAGWSPQGPYQPRTHTAGHAAAGCGTRGKRVHCTVRGVEGWRTRQMTGHGQGLQLLVNTTVLCWCCSSAHACLKASMHSRWGCTRPLPTSACSSGGRGYGRPVLCEEKP
jgi:hypothetical protein